MQRATSVHIVRYRNHLLEVFDIRGGGWQIVIYPPNDAGLPRDTISNLVPSELHILLAEAKARIDRILDSTLL